MLYDDNDIVKMRFRVFTQTHLLVGAAVFARPGYRAIALAGLAGALVPDTDVWAMFIIERIGGATGCEVFHYRYWEEPWTTLQSTLNSIPLYVGTMVFALIASLLAFQTGKLFFTFVAVFALSSLIHVTTDLMLHHDDARSQLLPFSDWVFRSPVSYWDPNYYGQVFAIFEIGLAITLIAIVGRRYARRGIWIILCVPMLGYTGSVAASFMKMADHDRGPGSCQIIDGDAEAIIRAGVNALFPARLGRLVQTLDQSDQWFFHHAVLMGSLLTWHRDDLSQSDIDPAM